MKDPVVCDKFEEMDFLTYLKPVLGKPQELFQCPESASYPSSLWSLKASPNPSAELGTVPTILGLCVPQGQAHVDLSYYIQMPIMVPETGLVYYSRSLIDSLAFSAGCRQGGVLRKDTASLGDWGL